MVLACLPLACNQAAPPAEETRPPAPVKVIKAEDADLVEWTELIGSTQPLPDRAARVTAAVEGRIVSVLRDEKGKQLAEGQPVKPGQVLVQLDDTIVQANLDKTQATIDEMKEQKKQARIAVEKADMDVKRLEDLQKTSTGPLPLASRFELEQARLSRKDAESKEQGLLYKEATLKAEMKAFEAQKAFYTLRAPIEGQLGLIQVMPGQTLPPGTPIVDVVDLSEIDVLCYVPPHAAARLALNKLARIAGEKEDGPNKTPSSVEGRITFIAVQALAETGNFAVKVRFPNPDSKQHPELKLRANTILRVQVQTQAPKKCLALPENALLEDQVPPRVVVVDPAKITTKKNDEGKEEKVGEAKKLRVITGVRDRNQGLVEIVGLTEDKDNGKKVDPQGLLFVVEGAHGLHEGDSLRLEEAEHAEKK
jgi:membrane fusion protein (multidrug efflux system)